MSFPPYPRYKPSGVDWLGEVPAHWEVCALKRIVRMRSGESITAEQIEETGDFPVYGGNGLRGYTSSSTHDGEFVLIGRQGALCGNVNFVRGKFWASEHAVVATPTTPVATRWLGEMLRAMNLNQYSVSAAQPGLSVELVGNLRTAHPPLDEQTRIAEFLGRETAKIDQLVAEQRRLMELLREKRQAVISHAVTRGLNPRVSFKPSGVEWLGDVPKHWEVTRLANVFGEISEPGSDDLPILSVSIHHGVSDEEISEEEMDRQVTRSEDRSKYKRVEAGDLTYNMMRAWQGGFGAVNVTGMVSPAYIVARPKRPLKTPFIEKLLRTPQAVEQMRRHSQGVTDFRLRLYWGEFKNLRVALPPVDEQRAIVATIETMEKEFDTLTAEAQRAIDLLQERRTALISAAVTGQIDVRGLAAAAVDDLRMVAEAPASYGT